jgi:lipopolysaccharide biosynthesis glycosyltransferase
MVKMDIVITIDKNYITQCIVLIYSIVSTNSKIMVNIYILSEDLTENNKQYITSYFNENNIVFYFIQIDSKLIKTSVFSSSDYITIATYYRLLIPLLLPHSLKKVLYLDCDMLVIGSLDELWETDISSYSTAVTIDAGCNDIRHCNRLGISNDFDYFNAGMLLINLKYWRENKIYEKTYNFIKENNASCIQHDQDALNKILLGTVKYVSVRYNYIESFFMDINNLLVKKKYFADIINSASCISIIHYAGGEKPWHNECTHPYNDIWHCCHMRIIKSKFKKNNRYKGLPYIKKIIREKLSKINLVEKRYISNISRDILNIKF